MRKINKNSYMIIVVALLSIIGMFSCSGKFVQVNGKLDGAEPALIRTATISVLTVRPSLAEPAYIISGALIKAVDGGLVTTHTIFRDMLNEKLNAYALTDIERADAEGLIKDLGSALSAEINFDGLTDMERLNVLYGAAKIINETAAVRR